MVVDGCCSLLSSTRERKILELNVLLMAVEEATVIEYNESLNLKCITESVELNWMI